MGTDKICGFSTEEARMMAMEHDVDYIIKRKLMLYVYNIRIMEI